MMEMAAQMLVSVRAKDTPVARASMLVAMARGSITRKEKEAFSGSSFSESASRTMFTPMRASRIKAIQWS